MFELSLCAANIVQNQDATPPTGFAENPILTEARNNTIFRADDSLGVVFPQLFNPITLEYIALELTVVRLADLVIYCAYSPVAPPLY